MHRLARWLLIAVALTAVTAVDHGFAQEDDASGAWTITIDPIPPTVVGERAVVVAHLANEGGDPVGGIVLVLYVHDSRVDSASTAENGAAVLRIADRLPAGTYDLRVTQQYDDATVRRPATTTAQLEIVPGSVEVELVPPLPGVEIVLTPLLGAATSATSEDSRIRQVSGADGLTRFPITHTGSYRIELILPWTSPTPGVKAEFSRWMDNTFEPWRVFEYKPGQRMQAGFEVHYLVDYQFTNLQGDPIDAGDVSKITLANSMGERFERTSHEPFWVKGGRVTRRTGGLEETQLQYSVDEVIVDGANVVNRAQHRFIPVDTRSWTIPLLFYSMSFYSADALFAFPVGTSIEVVSPNGTSRVVPLDEEGGAVLPLLPRGEYQVRVLNGGYSPPVPVALSKDQVVDLKVITLYDAAFVFGLGGSVALSLLLFGRWRPFISRRLDKRRQARRLRSS